VSDLIEIRGQVVGVQNVALIFAGRRDNIVKRVSDTVHREGIALQNTVRSHYLMGQSLNKRSGRLINSINERFTSDGFRFTSTVGSKLPYARFWELGFHGVEFVRSYVRSVATRDVRGFREDLKSHRGKVAGGIAYVRAHDRSVNQPPRSFLQPAIEERRGPINEALRAAVILSH
jgi:hypothetical protein